MKTKDYEVPQCTEFTMKTEGVLCYSTGNEEYKGSDYNEEWVSNI